jgi:hypothetical protein
VEDAELVAPGVAQDPEVKAALLLVVVALRYDRFRGFQRDIAMMYDTRLLSAVDVCSYRFLERLGRASPYFLELDVITPLIARTPTTKSLVRYEEMLMRLGPAIEAAIQPYVYFPTKEG